ncbi:MAG TPA: hypothetical protein ENN00_01755 [Bacillaceae bacterium]|nr:hypothetical protein [Bacillaceae bacterium]
MREHSQGFALPFVLGVLALGVALVFFAVSRLSGVRDLLELAFLDADLEAQAKSGLAIAFAFPLNASGTDEESFRGSAGMRYRGEFLVTVHERKPNSVEGEIELSLPPPRLVRRSIDLPPVQRTYAWKREIRVVDGAPREGLSEWVYLDLDRRK